MIVIIMHNVPINCGISKGMRNHNTDKKAAAKAELMPQNRANLEIDRV